MPSKQRFPYRKNRIYAQYHNQPGTIRFGDSARICLFCQA